MWVASASSDPPEAVFAGQTLARALLFQGRLEEASALAPHVEEAAQRHGLLALQLVVRGSLAYVDALRRRDDDLTRHAASIDELASQCPAGYLVAGSMVLTAYALATGQRAKEAADVLLLGAGGPQLPNIQLVDRAYGYELLVTDADGFTAFQDFGVESDTQAPQPPDDAGNPSAAAARYRAPIATRSPRTWISPTTYWRKWISSSPACTRSSIKSRQR